MYYTLCNGKQRNRLKIKNSRTMIATGMNRGDNLQEIYAWIDELPFSRPKKNLPRDFSDGVLMAEMLKVHYPRLVDVRNYIPASSVASKRDNWTTLNRKVFSKIEMKLSKDVIDRLANAQQGVIERLLIDLRQKIFVEDDDSVKTERDEPKCPDEKESTESNSKTAVILQNRVNREIEEDTEPAEVLDDVVGTSGSTVAVDIGNKNFIGKACGWLSGWVWPYNVSSKSNEKDATSSSTSGGLDHESGVDSVAEATAILGKNRVDAEDEETASSISRLDFLLLKEEVEEKNAAISMLNRRVSCLESVMKLKDQKIVNLAAKISAPVEAAQNLRPHVTGSSISRLRYQTKDKR